MNEESNPKPEAEIEAQVEVEERPQAPWMLSLGQLGLVALFSLLFLLVSYLPLRAGDLWGHILYGEWILEHRSLPAEDPVMPWAEGMKVVDTTWLSQAILAVIERAGGAEWLSVVFALTVLATCLILARAVYLVTGSKLASALGVLAALAIAWGRSTVFRPETFGALCFAVLLWLVVQGEERGFRGGYRVPLLFLMWANLHGSFGYGLLVLACCFLGRVIEVGLRTRSVGGVVADGTVRRWLYLGELGAAASLVNPYGIDLWLYLLRFGDGANLAALPELQPLVFRGLPGLTFALSWLVLLFVVRHSRRPLPAAHVLLLVAFAAAAVAGTGRLAWFGPVWALVAMPHFVDLAERFRGWRPGILRLAGRSWRFSALSAMLAFTACALSPVAAPVIGRQPRSLGQVLDPDTPLALTGFLAANPPAGPIFNPVHWGDWLALEGGSRLAPFVTSNTHLVPSRVLQAYSRILGAGYEWEVILGRHTIDTVVLDKVQNQRLVRAISLAEGWGLAYDDGTAMVFVRMPAPAPAATAAGGGSAEVPGDPGDGGGRGT